VACDGTGRCDLRHVHPLSGYFVCTASGVTYDGGSGWSFGNSFGSVVDAAMAFTPTADYTLDSISVAATHIVSQGDGPSSDLANVYLMSDLSGAPGSVIESFQVTMAQSTLVGQTSQLQEPLVGLSVLHPLLTSGTQYWLVMSAVDPNTRAAWWSQVHRLLLEGQAQQRALWHKSGSAGEPPGSSIRIRSPRSASTGRRRPARLFRNPLPSCCSAPGFLGSDCFVVVRPDLLPESHC
jgi:hypothetical protein